jgi:ATP-dependent RNA helicase DeaD
VIEEKQHTEDGDEAAAAPATPAPEEQTEEQIEDTTSSTSFEELGLDQTLLAAIGEMGFERPTEVQARTVPLALSGADLLVQSRTGSGKTCAFGIPLLQKLVSPDVGEVQALVLSPTRELALQVCDELQRLARNTGHRVLPVYGGAAIGPQTQALEEGVQIVVGTPGRVLDHMKRRNLKTDRIKILVLDEGDEMLSMGFAEEINAIIERLPGERQTMLFSATIPDEIQRMVDRHLTDPERLLLSEDFIGVREIHHIYYLVSGGDRPSDLLRVLEFEDPETALVFCNTRDDTSMVAAFLKQHDFKAEGISSDLTQAERERVMSAMRAGELRFLVATEVAARGIDLTHLTHVINYTFPESADMYVHRTGRTGRAGKSGVAISLVSPREIGSFYYLKLIHKIYPEERHLPSPEELASRREGERLEHLQRLFNGKQVSEEMRSLARRVWSTVDGERLTGLCLAALLDEHQEIYDAKKTTPPPRRAPVRTNDEAPETVRRGRDRPQVGRSRMRRDERPAQGARRRDRRDRDDRGPARKTTRSRRSERPERSDRQQGSFTTPDGDVEYWEALDGAPRDGGADRDSVRLYINIGRRHGASTSELVQFLQQETGLERSAVGRIQLRDTHCYVNVPGDKMATVIDGLTGKSYNNRTLRAEPAKK